MYETSEENSEVRGERLPIRKELGRSPVGTLACCVNRVRWRSDENVRKPAQPSMVLSQDASASRI